MKQLKVILWLFCLSVLAGTPAFGEDFTDLPPGIEVEMPGYPVWHLHKGFCNRFSIIPNRLAD